MNRRQILEVIASLIASWRAVPFGFSSPAPVTNVVSSDPTLVKTSGGKAGLVTMQPHSQLQAPPKFEDYASVEAWTNGEPVYGLDYMMYVYSISPDLMPKNVMQEGNANPRVKIKPKKSWEIEHNLLGSNTAQQPRSRQNDLPTFLPIHLIDGDRDTVWASWGSLRPDVYPEWIRIDLPIESTVASVALVLSRNFKPHTNFGRALPKELTIKVSRDAWRWEMVYQSQDINVDTTDTLEIKFSPRPAKQIWIEGNNFTKPLIENWAGLGAGMPGFSIGELEVRDSEGSNLALVSRGAGVTVSSTDFTHSDNRLTANSLWGPTQYDMGMKWMRSCGGACGPYQWFAMEKKRGQYEVDSVMDRWFTDLQQRGVNLILGLDMACGNPIYQNPPKESKWPEARWKGLPNPGWWVDQTPEMLEAWPPYVEFVVRHFRDRAYIWEVGNEWNGWGWDDRVADRYIKIFEMTYRAIKKAAPAARVMMGSSLTFAPDLLLTLLGQERKSGVWNGKLMASGGDLNDLRRSTLVISNTVSVRDTEIQVDGLNRGTWGILLRYQNPDEFLMAGCGNYMNQAMAGYAPNMVFITERTGGAWSHTKVSAKDIGVPFSEHLHFKARVEGSQASLTVSDSNREATITHRIEEAQLNRGGRLGLIQLTGANQAFQNFQVRDLEGKTVYREDFRGEAGGHPAGWRYVFGPNVINPIKPGWASKIDGLGWHPYNLPDADYFRAVREMQNQCAALGFKGQYYASEFYNFFSYPQFSDLNVPVPLLELGQGVMSAISAVGHSGVNAIGCTQIVYFTGSAYDASNCRLAWPSEVCVPVQPSVMYYMWRTMATVLDSFHAVEFPVRFSAGEELAAFTFQRANGERMVAAWLDHRAVAQPNNIAESRREVILQGIRARQAWGVDLMNGTEQELSLTHKGRDTSVGEILIKNYPALIRFSP